MFVTEVNSHREHIIELDKAGTHLKYFSQKKDVVLIKNLLLSVQGRWEKLVQKSVERGRLLDDARKRTKQVQLCAYLSSVTNKHLQKLKKQINIRNPREQHDMGIWYSASCIVNYFDLDNSVL